jgi:hypothetical protein
VVEVGQLEQLDVVGVAEGRLHQRGDAHDQDGHGDGPPTKPARQAKKVRQPSTLLASSAKQITASALTMPV